MIDDFFNLNFDLLNAIDMTTPQPKSDYPPKSERAPIHDGPPPRPPTAAEKEVLRQRGKALDKEFWEAI